MIERHILHAACAALVLTACTMPARNECLDDAAIALLPPQLDEASGIALSRRNPAVVWAHNDSEGTATLYALDRGGSLLADIAVPGAGRQFDWEDIAAGPCPAGDCLYIADIGDNFHDRDDRAIVRLTEPVVDVRDGVVRDSVPRSVVRDSGAHIHVERFPIAYPGGPEDAEAVFVTPDTTVFIVSKGRSRAVTLYRYPPPLRAGERVTLERVQQLSDGIAQIPDLVTGADASSDGERVVIRTYSGVTLYQFSGDTLAAARRIDLASLAEPQGEGVAIAGGDTLLFATETGPGTARPFLARAVCGFD